MTEQPPGDRPEDASVGRGVVLGPLSAPEGRFLARALRQETVGGILLLAAAVLGLVAANSRWADSYVSLTEHVVGPAALHLDLTLEEWAADGLLAIFFFIAGLELKRELVVGSLREPSKALLPVTAALAGMVVPAVLFLVVVRADPELFAGWAIPMATDIAFALAVLAVIASHLPPALRAFLLTLAIVDDMGAITVIALFYTDDLKGGWLLAAAAGFVLYLVLQQRRVTAWWIYVPLAGAVWVCMHSSGVHATLAGVALGLATRVRPDPDEEGSPAERLEHRLRPVSAGVAVPVFAFLSAGVALSSDTIRSLVTEPLALGIIIGLVAGKAIGIYGGSRLTVKLTRATLDPDLHWRDVAAMSVLAGIGFTVSLLISELAFEDDPSRLDLAKTSVLAASVLAAVLATVALRSRDRYYRDLQTRESGAQPPTGGPG